MASKYETVITTTGNDIRVEATLTRGNFKAHITHVLLGCKGNPALTYQEIQASALKAVMHLAQEELSLLQAKQDA